MGFEKFHPAVRGWFLDEFDGPNEIQRRGWEAIHAGVDTLIAAPTGSGKTLAAFLSSIDRLAREAERGLDDGVRVVYVSPLRALSNDIERNLRAPLAGITQRLGAEAIRCAVRTGDTTAKARREMVARPPHILVTTPESLYILLTSDGGRRALQTTETVIVDEIHAVVGGKRGAHLALTLERLEELAGPDVQRIGLSATQRPIERVARYLVGRRPDCAVVDAGHKRELDLAVELTSSPLDAVMSAEHMQEVYDRIAALIEEHTTTLVFTNTRREAERLTAALGSRIGSDAVSSHHGSLSRERRFESEQALKDGRLRALVATASLELGIDVGSVDLVVQVGSVRSIGTLLQRVGRSGHTMSGTPKGRVFPLTRDELVECAALLDSVRRGELDELVVPRGPADILAQQIVAMAAQTEEWSEEELFARVKRAQPYEDLGREEFEAVLAMLADGFAVRRGRRGAYLHWDQVQGRVRPRRGARITAVTSGGAIPDRADYRVVMDSDETFVGTLDEDFAIESMPGDIFQLGNQAWLIARVDSRAGQVRVHDARGLPPSIPFWFGEAPARTADLSRAVSRVRAELEERVDWSEEIPDASRAARWLVDEVGLSGVAASELTRYLVACRQALGAMPTQQSIVVERFFDEAENTHLVIHSPFGGRLNRAWGLALRKRFCRSFNFELQAAANEDAIILSMGPTHSFPLEQVFDFLNSRTVRNVLVQALLDAPMFGTRWRWNLNRSLAVPRFRGGSKVPAPLQRMQSEDMLAVVFPDQLACLENIQGDREIPEHPLVQQTISDCLTEAMDIEALEELLRAIGEGEVATLVRDVREPSPLSHQVINARPYAYLDPAPLEERRAHAIQTRGLLDPQVMGDLAALDAGAVDRVRDEVALEPPRDGDDLHDSIVARGVVADVEIAAVGADEIANRLLAAGRVGRLDRGLWFAAERSTEIAAAYGGEPGVWPIVPARFARREWSADEALREVVRSRLEFAGPATSEELAEAVRRPLPDVEVALAALEMEGFAFRGAFDPRVSGLQWCERGLLARIHRYTLARLRREIEPVAPSVFMRFLFEWHGVRGDGLHGPEGLQHVLRQLEGVSAAAGAWESEILPARLRGYDPAWLDMTCLTGEWVWGRLRGGSRTTTQVSPIGFCRRESAPHWLESAESLPEPTAAQARVLEVLDDRGASFFGELVEHSRFLKAQVEEHLGGLVAGGWVTADSFAGLRALITPSNRRQSAKWRRRAVSVGRTVEGAGRWTRLVRPSGALDESQIAEAVARTLLGRYGVIFRVIARRDSTVSWRALLDALRRMEARGEVRGGRFVNGFTGEQFAHPEAVPRLRQARKTGDDDLVTISAADPLNLTGVVVGDERITSNRSARIVFRGGVPAAVADSSGTRSLLHLDSEVLAAVEAVLRPRQGHGV